MRVLLMGMCLIDLVDHDRPQDADDSWEKADKWTFSKINFCCKPETQASLTDNMSTNQAWTTLETCFSPHLLQTSSNSL